MKEQSKKLLETLFGPSGLEFAKQAESKFPEFAKLVDEVGMERIWSRKGLTLREKSLLTIASQAGMGRWDQVKIHAGSFLHTGGTRQELIEIFIHLAMYCGFPAAIAGLRALEELERDGAKSSL